MNEYIKQCAEIIQCKLNCTIFINIEKEIMMTCFRIAKYVK